MKELIIKSALIALVSAAPLVAYNVIVDPFGTLRSRYDRIFVCPNERYAKTKIVLESRGRYDSLLFGSSVVSQVPMETLNGLTGAKFYNMSYIAGMPSDHLAVLKHILGAGVRLKNVVIGLDLYSFRHIPEGLRDSRTKMYPEGVIGKGKYYFDYLVEEPDSSILYEIRFDGKEARYDFYTTGQYYYMHKERQLLADPSRHEARFRFPPVLALKERIALTMKELREIEKLCRDNGISLTFYLNPVTTRWYLCDDMKFIDRVRRALLEFGPYWDFTGVNAVTSDIFSFYDMIHYRPQVGEYMAQRLFDGRAKVPADFGRRITPESVDGDERWFAENYAAGKKRQDFRCFNDPVR